MDLLDKLVLLEANSVNNEEYERMTGVTLDEHMRRMKLFVTEVKAKTVKALYKEVADGEQAFVTPMIERMSIPMAAGAKKKSTIRESSQNNNKK